VNAIFALLCSAALGQTTTTTLTPVADTSLDSRSGIANAGTSTTLSADLGSDWHKDAYLRFAVPANVGLVTKAVLRLHVTNGSTGGGELHLSRYADAWSEASTTLPKDPEYEIGHFKALNVGDVLERDVTSAVSAGLPLDVHLTSDTSDGIGFDSREGAQPPQLVVTSLASQSVAGPGLGAVVSSEADTYAVQNDPTANHGADTTIFADNNDGLHEYLGFVRFPISPARGSRTITRATVRLFVSNGSTGRSSLLPFGDVLGSRWSETGLTWLNLPRHGVRSPMEPRVLQGLTANTWLELDATAAAQTNDYVSLQIATATPDGLGFASREATANRPELLLEFAPLTCSTTVPCASTADACLSGICVQTCSASSPCSPGTVCTASATCAPGMPPPPAGPAGTSAVPGDDP